MRVNRDFAVFWVVQTLSEIGNGFALVALPLLVLQATGSAARMGLLTAVAGVGGIAAGLFAGVLADRVDRRKLMLVADGARAVLFGLIPLCWAVRPQVWLLYVVMALVSVFAMIFEVTWVTAVPNLVGADEIVTANSRLETTNALAVIAGPVLAGTVASLFGPTAAIGLNAATFLVSVLGLAVIRLRVPSAPQVRAARWTDLRTGFVTGLAFLWRTPVLRAVTVLLTVETFVSLGMTDVFIFYLRHQLGQPPRIVGYVLGVAGLGTIVGAALTPLLRRRWGFGVCWLGSYVLCGVAVAVVAGLRDTVEVALAVAVYTFGQAVAGVCSMTLRQQVTPDHLLGRVTSAFWVIHSALGPVGAVVLTASVGAVGVRVPLLAAGGALLLMVCAGLATPIRQRHPEKPVPVRE